MAFARLTGAINGGRSNDRHKKGFQNARNVVALYGELYVSIENGSLGEQRAWHILSTR
jgi:hypothetical protein